MNLEVEITWEPCGNAELASDQSLALPQIEARPGVYQWVLTYGGQTRHYVGEAGDLSQRFKGYMRPGSGDGTNRRMRNRAERVLAEGGTVEIFRAFDTNIRFVVDGTTDAEPDLSSEFARRFVENAVLISLLASGCAVVNGRGYGKFHPDGVLD